MSRSTRVKGLSLFIVCAMLLSFVHPLGVQRSYAQGELEGTIVADTFENGQPGAPPVGWHVPAAPAAGADAPDPYILKAGISQLDGYDGQVLKLEKNGKSVSSYSIRRDVANASPKIVMTYKVRAEQTNAVVYLPSLQNGAQVKFALNGGQFSYMKENATGWTSLAPYQSGVWHEVRIMLDSELGVYDFYVDNKLLLSQEKGGKGTPLSSFYLGFYKDSIGTVYFDDFYIQGYKPATSASLTESTIELSVGESKQLALQFQPADATVQSAQWSTDNPSVATVSTTGVVSAVTAGTATITAQPAGGLPALTAAVTVKESVRSVGDVLAETFEANPYGQAPSGWTIPSKPAAAPPAPNPYILAASVEESPGEANKVLKLTKNANSMASYSITRAIQTTSTKVALTYRIKAEQNNAVIYLPSLNNGAQVKFALNGGQFAYMKEGASAWTNIQPYVSGEWYDVKVMLDSDAGEFDFYLNGQLKLSREKGGKGGPLTSFYLGIYKDSIGTVYFDDFHVYSYKPANAVSFSQEEYDLAKDTKLQLSLLFEPSDATVQSAVWTSSDPEIASVSSSGVVTGHKKGMAVISAKPVEDIAAASATVHVYSLPITSITLDEVSSPVPAGSRMLLKAHAQPEDSTNQRITWGSERPDIATVDRYGELTAIGPGTTKVYALSPDGDVRGETTVTVIARAVQHNLYVSTEGNDSHAGTIEQPLRTIERAQAKVRELNAQMSGDIMVHLRGGTYTLADALEWQEADSGKNGYFVIYQSYPGEQAMLSGGKRITGWTEHDAASGIYKSEVGGNLETRQLFIDGVRAVRARSEGGLIMPVQTATGYISNDTELASLDRISDLELVFHEKWTNPRAGVSSISIVDGKAAIEVKQPAWTAISNRGLTSATVPVYYENAYELLDQPGEWYYNQAEGMLYYKPRSWEDLAEAEVIAPVLERMMTIRGKSADEPVRNLVFRDLSFAYTTWMRPSTDAGHSDAQNNHLRYPGTPDQLPETAIDVELANSIVFTGNTFTKLGITAIRMVNGVQNALVEGNHFFDLSGSALNIGSPDSVNRHVFNPEDHRLVMKNNDIINNVIHDIGVDYKSASAISAGYPVDMDISHNEMYSLPYSGTHIGYGWAKDFDPVTKDVRIQNNLIYDLMGMGLNDGGAIYSLGTTGATAANKNTVSGNYIRNQMEQGAPLYTDEGSAYWKFEHNVIDLKDTPPWHSAMRWAQIWAASIHDIDFVNNYTTEANYTGNGYDNRFENNQVYPEGNWPAEAQAIIENSGLQESYAALAEDNVRRWSVDLLNLSVGGSEVVQLHASSGKDEPMDLNSSEIYYFVDNEDVASVNEHGVVTGVGKGSAKLTIEIVNGTLLRTLRTDIFVGDELKDVGLEGTAGQVAFMKAGTGQAWSAYGNTAYGNRIELDSLTFAVSNPEIASVTEQGEIKAHRAGDTVLTVQGQFLDSKAVSRYLLRVTDHETAHDYSLLREINDAAGWHVEPTATNNVQAANHRITISTPSGGHAIYQGRQFASELVDFNLQVNGSGGWYALMFGKQNPTSSYVSDDNYIMVITASAIELHRYNGSKRTVIFGNLDGYTSLGGDAIPNTMLPYNTMHRVQLGSFVEEDGVRLVVKVDGVSVIDYLDTAPEALKKPGYAGLIARSGSMTLAAAEGSQSQLAALVLDEVTELEIGDRRQLTASGVYEHGGTAELAAEELAFTSSDPSIASVTAEGELHVHKTGAVTIRAVYRGLEAQLQLKIGHTAGEPGSPSPGGGISVQPLPFDLLKDARMNVSANEDGQLVKTVTVDAGLLSKAFAQAERQQLVVMQLPGTEPIVKVELPAADWQAIGKQNGQAVLELVFNQVSYQLPAALMLKLVDAEKITIILQQASGELAGKATDALKGQGLQQADAPIVEFRLEVDGREVTDFEGIYVKRTIQVESVVDPRSTTAVRIDKVGGVYFAPSTIRGEKETSIVEIKSPHNSLYTVVHYSKSFQDMEKHWAKADVELMAGKLIVKGVAAHVFAPNASITRAEFAALLVRALGIEHGDEVPLFTDVSASKWYAGAVTAAHKAGLIAGYADGAFQPDAAITREQMAVMLVRASKKAGLKAAGEESVLQNYADRDDISDWAADSAAAALQLGLIQGMTSSTFAPKELATRAQSAVMLKRLLLEANLING